MAVVGMLGGGEWWWRAHRVCGVCVCVCVSRARMCAYVFASTCMYYVCVCVSVCMSVDTTTQCKVCAVMCKDISRQYSTYSSLTQQQVQSKHRSTIHNTIQCTLFIQQNFFLNQFRKGT